MNDEQERSASEWAAYFWAGREAILDSGDLEDMQSEVGVAASTAYEECEYQLVNLIPDLLAEIEALKNERQNFVIELFPADDGSVKS